MTLKPPFPTQALSHGVAARLASDGSQVCLVLGTSARALQLVAATLARVGVPRQSIATLPDDAAADADVFARVADREGTGGFNVTST